MAKKSQRDANPIDLEALFELRRKADMRAIKMWQAATGRTLVWPDQADLCVWLLERVDEALDLLEKMDGIGPTHEEQRSAEDFVKRLRPPKEEK